MEKKYISFNIKILIIFLFYLSANCYIKIPFEYYPVNIRNNTTPNTIMDNLIQKKIYIVINIGQSSQKIHVPITFSSNDFYIVDDAINVLNSNEKKFKDLLTFDRKKTQTLEIIEELQGVYGDEFEFAEYCKDKFYFGNSNTDLSFYLATYFKNTEIGGIGFQLKPYSDITTTTPDETRTFLKQMKDKNLINKFIWSIFFNEKGLGKEDKGFILLGDYPHLTNSDLGYYEKEQFNPDNLYSVNIDLYYKVLDYKFDFDEISALNNKNEIIPSLNFGINSHKVYLDYNFGGIKGSQTFYSYLEKNVFNEFIENNECFKDTIRVNYLYDFFYCKNNKNLLSKIKNKFPTLMFKSNDLNSNFSITPDDLFVQKGDYIFCLMVFSSSYEYYWKLGIPFLKKYQFTTNVEAQKFIYYSYSPKTKSIGISNKTLVFIIIVLSLICIGIGIGIGKLIYDKYIRKKRANELEENFEYETDENKKKNKDKGEGLNQGLF